MLNGLEDYVGIWRDWFKPSLSEFITVGLRYDSALKQTSWLLK